MASPEAQHSFPGLLEVRLGITSCTTQQREQRLQEPRDAVLRVSLRLRWDARQRGIVGEPTIDALTTLRKTGRKLILVSGVATSHQRVPGARTRRRHREPARRTTKILALHGGYVSARLPVRFRPASPVAESPMPSAKWDAEGGARRRPKFLLPRAERASELRAQNLDRFKQISDGVDDATWEYHLKRHDVSRWFREVIKDDDLAAEAAQIEGADLSPDSEPGARAPGHRASIYDAGLTNPPFC